MSLITAEDLKVEMSQAQSPDDEDLINRIVEGVWGYWCELTDRQWESDTRTEYHDPDPGAYRLYLYETPITQIVGLYEDPYTWTYGPEALLAPSTYTFDDIRGIIHRPWIPFLAVPGASRWFTRPDTRLTTSPRASNRCLSGRHPCGSKKVSCSAPGWNCGRKSSPCWKSLAVWSSNTSATMFNVIIEAEAAKAMLDDIIGKTNDLSPVLKKIQGMEWESIIRNFEESGRPPWQPLSPKTLGSFMGRFAKGGAYRDKSGALNAKGQAKQGSRKPLIDTGTMERSVRPGATGSNSLEMVAGGGAASYAPYQHFGTGKIPARPFMVWQPNEVAEFNLMIRDFITGE